MPLGLLPSNYGRPWGEGPFWYFAKQETLTDSLCWLFERSQSLLSSEKSKLNLAEEETRESSNHTFFAWFCLVGSPGFVIESCEEETRESMNHTFFAWRCPVRSLRFEYDIHLFCRWGKRLLLPLLGNNCELQLMMFLSSSLWWWWWWQ
jgi:hypothetical protein